MKEPRSLPAGVHGALAAALLGGIFHLAPWPLLQGAVHACLVVGLAPAFRSPLVGGLWAAAAGWVLEGALRAYPHLGGTALGDLSACLIASWVLRRWRPGERGPFLARLALLVLLQALLVHGAVRWAAGPHLWGSGWLGGLATVPLWGAFLHRIHRRPPRR